MTDPSPETSGKIPLKWQMFILSFTALFLELMVIRWVPSVVRLVAYYANLMLLSSFLGLGIGAIASGRKWRLFGWFPVLLAVYVGALLLSRELVLGSSGTEMRFGAADLHLTNYAILVALFVVNALVFVPIGQQMGRLFGQLPRLRAYAWDLGGSLCGTLAFGLFSLLHFSPVAGMAGVMVLYLSLLPRRRWLWSAPLFALVFAGLWTANDRTTLWSPYYHITIRDLATGQLTDTPPPGIAAMHDPPLYQVSVNQDFYHLDGSQDVGRYTPGTKSHDLAIQQKAQYDLPYLVGGPRARVLVVGAGGGADVQGALRHGAQHVDAVEIDPVVAAISRRFNADAPYADPRVTLIVDDARSFISKARPGGYDLVTFGYLDSQALFSSMTNLRLDGYVYTVESIRTAYGLLKDDGLLTLSFGYGQHFLLLKLYRMVAEATGRIPLMYESPGHVVFFVPKTKLPGPAPLHINGLQAAMMPAMPQVEPATDDWPFLYLWRKTVPLDYVIVIAGLLVVSLLAVGSLRGRSFGRNDLHFALLGMGFLLLETKSITDCSLYFGATWLVTLIVVLGVLLMVLASNVVAGRIAKFSFWFYAPLFAALLLLTFVPREAILTLGIGGRLAWVLFVVPLPVFFAGLIFSTGFRHAVNPGALFGANLIGAMAGGFSEYLGMAIGSHQLSYLVIAAYAGSLLCLMVERRRVDPRMV